MIRIQKNILAFVAPFATWIGLQMLLPATATAYALRTFATAAVGIFSLYSCRPQKTAGNGPLLGATLFWGLFGGLGVAVLWIAPESSSWYRTWLELPLGRIPPETTPSPYDPAVCGWTLTAAKLFGSAFVIAPVEEIFFRSFLYRWLQYRDFTAISLSRWDLSAFLWMVFLFTLEHDRPLVAALAGTVYGLLAIRVNLTSAIIAHVVTNFALGLHVICRGEWGFW